MIAAVNAIANDGVRIDPSLVDGSATLDDGTEVGTDQADERRVISTQAARQTALMMERVLDPVDGVAPLAAVPGYRIAGKTGTAQRVVDSCGCYDGSHTASFVGFGPTDDPRFTVVRGDPRLPHRWRWRGRRPGVRQADEPHPPAVRRTADRHPGLAASRRVVTDP